jgi:hypothetical protein
VCTACGTVLFYLPDWTILRHGRGLQRRKSSLCNKWTSFWKCCSAVADSRTRVTTKCSILEFPLALDSSAEGNPYGIYRPEPSIPPPAYQRPSVSEEATAKVDEWWADINSTDRGFPSQTARSHPLAPPGLENIRPRDAGSVPRESTPFSRTGPSYPASPAGFYNKRPRNIQPATTLEVSTTLSQPKYVVLDSHPPRLPDTSVAGASPWAAPAGNTRGLRPVQRRTWNIEAMEWRTYWVWAYNLLSE